MIIKSIPRKHVDGFRQLTEYITREEKGAGKTPLLFSYGLYSEEPQKVAKEMADNYAYRRKVHTEENSLLHYVLSFHEEDTVVLEEEVVRDIVDTFVEEFNPNGMTYGAMHEDRGHRHIHLLLCANEIASNKLIYKRKQLTKAQQAIPKKERTYKERTFEESKNRVRSYARERAKRYAKEKDLSEQYQREGLFASFNENYAKSRSALDLDETRTRNSRGLRAQRDSKRKRPTSRVQLLQTDILAALNRTGNFTAFIREVQKKYTVYKTSRGTINGIEYNNKHWRFTSLLPAEAASTFKTMRREYYSVREKQNKRQQRYHGRDTGRKR